jgi:hypothetical protein
MLAVVPGQATAEKFGESRIGNRSFLLMLP